MIESFKDDETRKIFEGRFSSKVPRDIQRVALRKLIQLNAAATIAFLSVPPGNHLERLSRDREGQWGIRINDQWRICFEWEGGNARNVEITDYH